jgi:hypothetical protein
VNTQFSSTQNHNIFFQSFRSKHTSSLRFPFHMLTGLPLLHFPCWFYSATCLEVLQPSIRMTWLYRLNCCSSVSCNMSFFVSIFVLIVLFLVLSIRDSPTERLNYSISVANNLFPCFRIISHVSAQYVNILFAIDLCIVTCRPISRKRVDNTFPGIWKWQM